jgi:hypothetical protein
MGSQKETKLAYGLAAILLIVGVVCYAAVPAEKPDEPVRKVYKSLGGDVMFDHQMHAQVDDCAACHHHGETGDYMSCAECHRSADAKTVAPECMACHPLTGDTYVFDEHHGVLETEPEAWTCKDCHALAEGEDIPASCSECHDPDYGDAMIMKFQKTSDALHDQCIGCHEDYGAGPVACGECHAQ